MSHSGKPFSRHEMGLEESLSNRFQENFTIDGNTNKPDFKELDLLAPIPAKTSSSSSNPSSPAMHSKSPFGRRSNVAAAAAVATSTTTTPEKLRSVPTDSKLKPGHRRSSSAGAPLIYSGNIGSYFHNSSNSSANTTSSSSGTTTNSGGGSGGGGGGATGGGSLSSVSSPNTNLYPSGNICPSGKILKSNIMGSRNSSRTEKLGLGTGNYGHGSIIRSGGKLDANTDHEEIKKAGNELYRRGNYAEALSLYDRAISISPENAACRSNRAAALTKLGRLGEAVKECEEAVRLDPGFERAHQRLASLYLRLGQAELARLHLLHGQLTDTTELQKLQTLEKHITRCSDARKIGDWKGALRECDAAMLTGAVSSPQIIACKAEAFLKLQQLEDADSSLSDLQKLEPYPASCSQIKFFGMLSEAYLLYVRAQVDMALGRFEGAAVAAEKAGLIDYSNIEVAMLLNNVKLVARARARGKDLFDSGRFSEACSAYGEGLNYNLSNAVLYCNRAVCWSKLGLWEQSVKDCNEAIKIQPNYTKALLRRAVSNAKLERWSEAVRDYEVLRKELPGDNEVIESLSRAQDALKRSRGYDGSAFDRDRTMLLSAGGCATEAGTNKDRR